MSGGSLISGIGRMRIRIVDANTKEHWLYNVYWDRVKDSLPAYERLYIMDDEFLDKIAIEMAIKSFFGEKSIFTRDTSIRSYIYGKIKENKRVLRAVFIFFEP